MANRPPIPQIASLKGASEGAMEDQLQSDPRADSSGRAQGWNEFRTFLEITTFELSHAGCNVLSKLCHYKLQIDADQRAHSNINSRSSEHQTDAN